MRTRAMGVAIPILFGAALLAWGAMLYTLRAWFGQPLEPGRGSDRLIAQAWTGGAYATIWVLLAGALLVAGAQGVISGRTGWLAWIVHPLCGLAGLAAIGVMYEPANRWPVAIPVLLPWLLAAFATGREWAGFAAALVALSIAPLFVRFASERYWFGTPPPEVQEQALAENREMWRQTYLEEIRTATRLEDLEPRTRKGSSVLQEALARMRELPDRRTNLIRLLQQDSYPIVRVIPELAIEPDAQLCSAAQAFLAAEIRQYRSSGNLPYAVLEDMQPGLIWMAQHCGIEAEIDALEKLARVDSETGAQTTQKFLDALTEMRRASVEKR